MNRSLSNKSSHLPNDPSKWSVYQVSEFIGNLTNDTIRKMFFDNDINGEALLLLTEKYLRETMHLKIGHSLIIANKIQKLRELYKNFFP